MNKTVKKFSYITATSVCAVLLAAFILWWRETSCGAVPRLAALLSAGLFAAAAVRIISHAVDTFPPEETQTDEAEEPRCFMLRIFVFGLAVDLAWLVLVFLLRRLFGYSGSLEFWECLDSGHYLDIAEDWYLSEGDWDRLVQLVFLPGFPLAVRLAAKIVGSTLYAGLIVSALSFSASLCVLYRLLSLDYPRARVKKMLKYFCLAPGGFFLAAPMSESLFLLLAAACLYCARRGRWLVGCLLGGAAAFTRSIGLTLLAPLLVEALYSLASTRLSQRKGVCRLAALLLVPLGFAAYCLINYQVSGNAFQFLIYQKQHWGQSLGWFFNTAAYQTQYALDTLFSHLKNFWGLWLPNLVCSFAALVVMLCAARRVRGSYALWFLGYYVIAIGATWLLSAPRYLLVLFPLYIGLGELTKSEKADRAVTLTLALLSLLYTCAFALRWQVW